MLASDCLRDGAFGFGRPVLSAGKAILGYACGASWLSESVLGRLVFGTWLLVMPPLSANHQLCADRFQAVTMSFCNKQYGEAFVCCLSETCNNVLP
jgi:hypothetical protein